MASAVIQFAQSVWEIVSIKVGVVFLPEIHRRYDEGGKPEPISIQLTDAILTGSVFLASGLTLTW